MMNPDSVGYDIVLESKLDSQKKYIDSGLSIHLECVVGYMRGKVNDEEFMESCDDIVGRIKAKQEIEQLLNHERG